MGDRENTFLFWVKRSWIRYIFYYIFVSRIKKYLTTKKTFYDFHYVF